MDNHNLRQAIFTFLILGFISLFTACGSDLPKPTTANPVNTLTDEPADTQQVGTSTPLKPTDTPVPLAVLVNGEPITLEEYEAELSQYASAQAQSGMNLATDAESVVLDDLINQVLLAQAAYEAGDFSDTVSLQERMDKLAEKVGGTEALVNWYTKQGYSEPAFRIALARSIAAAWMRDKIISEVPTTAEQVHARQILLYNEAEATQAYDLLQSGQDFETLVNSYDPVTHGDLGWFPRGYLTQAGVEQAAFDLEPGQYSQVIHSDFGYHIVQVIEKDSQHTLDPEAYADLQIQTLQEWLEQRRAMSEIQILLP